MAGARSSRTTVSIMAGARSSRKYAGLLIATALMLVLPCVHAKTSALSQEDMEAFLNEINETMHLEIEAIGDKFHLEVQSVKSELQDELLKTCQSDSGSMDTADDTDMSVQQLYQDLHNLQCEVKSVIKDPDHDTKLVVEKFLDARVHSLESKLGNAILEMRENVNILYDIRQRVYKLNEKLRLHVVSLSPPPSLATTSDCNSISPHPSLTTTSDPNSISPHPSLATTSDTNSISPHTSLATTSATNSISPHTSLATTSATNSLSPHPSLATTSATNSLSSHPPPATTSDTNSACAPEWVKDPLSNSCYYFSQAKGSWQMSVWICEQTGNGSHLVSIETERENAFVRSNNNYSNAWIGAHLDADKQSWVWSHTGSPVDYRDWRQREPSGDRHTYYGEDCLELNADQDYDWNDSNCKAAENYPICQLNRMYNQTCGEVWATYNTSCYFVGTYRLNFGDAERFCIAMSADLAIVDDAEIQYFLASHLRARQAEFTHGRFWLDGTDITKEGSWVWMETGKSIGYENWHTNEPNNANNGVSEQCAELSMEESWSGSWNDIMCHSKRNVICEIELES